MTSKSAESYIHDLEQRVQTLEEEFVRLQASAEGSRRSALEKLTQLKRQFDEKRSEIATRIASARDTGGAAWSELRDGLESTWNELKDALDRARKELVQSEAASHEPELTSGSRKRVDRPAHHSSQPNLVFSVTILPVGSGDDIDRAVSDTVATLRERGLTYQVTGTCTLVEGPWHEVMPALERSILDLAERHPRVHASIAVDYHGDRTDRLKTSVTPVEAPLEAPVGPSS